METYADCQDYLANIGSAHDLISEQNSRVDTNLSMRRQRQRPFLCARSYLVGRFMILLTVLLLLNMPHASGFVPATAGIVKKLSRSIHRTNSVAVYVATTTEVGSSINNLRQYVPLGVSVLVIIDILLGSPMANGLLNKIRPTETDTTNENDETNARKSQNINSYQPSKERIDSQKVAQDAIQRARYTLELRSFLDAQRDPVVELQRKMDQQAAMLDTNQKKLQDEMQRSKND